MTEKYGKERVAQIVTFGTLGARGVLRDVGRALAIPYADVDRVTRLVPLAPGMTLERALQESPELAATAQAWAQRCVFEHSSTDLGENLSARTDQADPAQIVAAWAAEAQHYDYKRNRCESGQICGHYTQVVWRGTQQIGCAVARCSNAGPFGGGPWFNWVCNYDPPGNWQGERPY